MAELEIRVVSMRREGLLVELARVVYEYGYALLRQRLTQEAQGASLIMVLRGPDELQLALEDALGTHPGVLSFESLPYESASANRGTLIAGTTHSAASARAPAATFTPVATGADIA